MTSLRTMLDKGQPLLGLSVMYPSPGAVERIGPDWDWIWVDGQHGEMGYLETLSIVRACDLIQRPTVVRVPGHEAGPIGKTLDMGAGAVIVPCVDTPEQARAVVEAAKFPPLGKRSYGSRRNIDFQGRSYSDTANDDTVLIAQIESPQAIENADAIAATKGVNALFLGPDDLMLRRGFSMTSPKSKETLGKDMEIVAQACRRHNKVGVMVGVGEEMLRLCLSMGYQMIVSGSDVGFLATSSKQTTAEAARHLQIAILSGCGQATDGDCEIDILMPPRVLSMADMAECDDVLDPLRRVSEVVVRPPDADLLRREVGEFDVYLASLHVKLEGAQIEAATRLKAIATPSTGLDHIDVKAAEQRGITILSLRDDKEFLNSLTATAELAWALLLCVVRRLPWAVQSAHAGIWARDKFRGHQLSGKTLGIIGYGRLGRMVAEYGKVFRMRVVTTDARPVTPAAGVEVMPLPQLLRESDVISIHVHLTDETRGLLGREQFKLMKKDAVLINTSRGAIVDEQALLDALKNGAIGGAGLDVIDGEWRPDLDQHPLIRYAQTHENLVISPHIGGVTYESQRLAYARTVEMIMNFMRERRMI